MSARSAYARFHNSQISWGYVQVRERESKIWVYSTHDFEERIEWQEGKARQLSFDYYNFQPAKKTTGSQADVDDKCNSHAGY